MKDHKRVRSVRVENNYRSAAIAARAASGRRRADGPGFEPAADEALEAPAEVAATEAAGGIEALLALQVVDDPLFERRKAIRRGHALLDTLDAMKADLLAGRIGEGRLNQLMALISQARKAKLGALDPVLDEIELRALVELAKLGRYPDLPRP